MAAADTFRAAAGEQLTQWANRAGVELIGGQDGADPASVVYDAIAATKARNADVFDLRYSRKTSQQEEPYGRASQDLPHYRKRISGSIFGKRWLF